MLFSHAQSERFERIRGILSLVRVANMSWSPTPVRNALPITSSEVHDLREGNETPACRLEKYEKLGRNTEQSHFPQQRKIGIVCGYHDLRRRFLLGNI